jgi:hypothetical protein
MRETNTRGRSVFSNRGHLGYRERNRESPIEKERKGVKVKKKFGSYSPEARATCHNAQLGVTYDKASLPTGRPLLAAGGAMFGLSIFNRAASSHKRMLF